MYLVTAILIVLAVILFGARHKIRASSFKTRGFGLYREGQRDWAHGRYDLARGKYDRAIKAFDEAVRLNPRDHGAFVARGQIWFAMGEYDRALKVYDDAIQLYRDKTWQGVEMREFVAALYSRAKVWAAKKDYEQAIKDYDWAISLYDRFKNYDWAISPNARHFFDRGEVLFAKGEYDRAIKDFDEAIRRGTQDGSWIKLSTYDAKAFHRRGTAWLAKREYVRAIADFDVAICLDFRFADAFLARGHAWRAKKDHDQAIEDYDEAIRLAACLEYYRRYEVKPGSIHLHAFYGKACCLAVHLQTEFAIENLRSALELGYRDFDRIEQDSDLDSIRSEPRYRELLDKYSKRADILPCNLIVATSIYDGSISFFQDSVPRAESREREWKASALSQLDFRVDRRQFAAGVVDLHLPVDTALSVVDVG